MHFRELGITRLARQTGSIARHPLLRRHPAQFGDPRHPPGQGPRRVSAQISAVMEAAEYAIAEAPRDAAAGFEPRRGASGGLRDARLHASAAARHGDRRAAAGALGRGLGARHRRTVLVPYDAVVLGTPPCDLPASRNRPTASRAGTQRVRRALHGLCEVVERDAVCLWGYKSDAAAKARGSRPRHSATRRWTRWFRQIARAGYQLRLFDQTSNIGVPVIYAVLLPARWRRQAFRRRDRRQLPPGSGGRGAARHRRGGADPHHQHCGGARRHRRRRVRPGARPQHRRADRGCRPRARRRRACRRRTDRRADRCICGRARRGPGSQRIVVMPLGGAQFGIDVARRLSSPGSRTG